MRNRINVLALAVILGGAAMLASPSPASATYINPWTDGDGGGITYCCRSDGASCCFVGVGCTTKPGVCGPLL